MTQKFRIHCFEHVRHTFEVEAESIEAAYARTDALINDATPMTSEFTGDYDPDVCVDPLLPDGEVDYERSRWFLPTGE